jgi:hypothetical protein
MLRTIVIGRGTEEEGRVGDVRDADGYGERMGHGQRERLGWERWTYWREFVECYRYGYGYGAFLFPLSAIVSSVLFYYSDIAPFILTISFLFFFSHFHI